MTECKLLIIKLEIFRLQVARFMKHEILLASYSDFSSDSAGLIAARLDRTGVVAKVWRLDFLGLLIINSPRNWTVRAFYV